MADGPPTYCLDASRGRTLLPAGRTIHEKLTLEVIQGNCRTKTTMSAFFPPSLVYGTNTVRTPGVSGSVHTRSTSAKRPRHRRHDEAARGDLLDQRRQLGHIVPR